MTTATGGTRLNSDRPPRRPDHADGDRLPTDPIGQYLEEISRYDLLTADDETRLAQTMEAGLEAEDRLASDDNHTAADRRKLERQARAGHQAKDEFLAANLRLVVANAHRYATTWGLDLLDLIQEGNLGLIRAVEKFDWRKGFKFSTYATWWIRQAITRAFAEKSRTIRLPVYLHDTVATVWATEGSLKAASGRDPTPHQIADEAGLPLPRVQQALELFKTVSLQLPVGEDSGAELGHLIEDEHATDPAAEAELAEISGRLQAAIDRLPDREQRIISLRYGFTDGTPHRRDEIGDEFGVTQERIRQLEKLALCRLRHPALGLQEADYL